jgi:pimeloyl-ACP methyl ester carboxylesterase
VTGRILSARIQEETQGEGAPVATVPQTFTELGDEFALVHQAAAEAGLTGTALPRARRGWVNVPTGGHVSGVFWGAGSPEIVFLHDRGESARAWDATALAAGRASVAIDLPGHGRSDWRRDGRYEPGKLAPAVAEAIRSFAPRAGLVVGSGLGGLTAIALHRRHPQLLPRLALINTLPGSVPARTRIPPGAERFASQQEAFAILTARRSGHSRQALHREILYELRQDPDGTWVWRHHPGNVPDPGPGPDDGTLWDELAQFATPVALIRSDWAGGLTAAGLARLRQRTPQIQVITIPGGGDDIAVIQPVALAATLVQLLSQETPAAD